MSGRRHHLRFVPPVAGGAPPTGWEALDKWVGGSGSSPADASEKVEETKKTGWEALDKWVGGGSGGGTPNTIVWTNNYRTGKTQCDTLNN